MKGLKILSEMDRTAKAKRYPGVPVHVIPKTKFSDATSNGLTKAIIQWLTLNGSWATRVSSAGRYLPNLKKFIPSTTKAGTADIHAVIGGRHASIEVKIGRDRMSKAQEQMKKQIEGSGGLYFVARDFDSFIEWYNAIKN
jgi:hypothetical protein